MATTALGIINSSLRLIGVATKNEALDDADAQNSLTALNFMLDSWSARRVTVRHIVEDSKILTAGSGFQYTIGVGGSINTAFPIQIESAYLKLTPDTNMLSPIDLISSEQFDAYLDRLVITGITRYLYYDPIYPLGNIFIYPTPDKAYTLYIKSWKALSSLTLLTSDITLEPVYLETIKYNLAIRLAPEFGVEPKQVVVDGARELFDILLRLSAPNMTSFIDYPVRRRSGPWAIYTGD